MPRPFQFRRFGPRLLFFIAGLVALAQLSTYALVSRANRRNALASIEDALERGSRQFNAIARRQEGDLLLAARTLAGDYAMRQLLVRQADADTTRSALRSYLRRIGADAVVMLEPDGGFVADADTTRPDPRHASFFALRARADLADTGEAAGWGFVGPRLQQIVVVPMYAPEPEIAAWIAVGKGVDQAAASELKNASALDVTFLAAGPEARILASTLPAPAAAALGRLPPPAAPGRPTRVDLLGDDYISAYRPLRVEGETGVWVVLQRSLEAELEPSRRLEALLVAITLAGLAVAVVAALALARSLARPVQRLAEHTRRIAAGDYETRLDLRRRDELGQLADSFNAMSSGLAERDRVRDLLDKNVSPEVAAQLVRQGAALGGEEREVTILFCDLRGFTSLSEGLPPRALVTLLNRYLDRMSSAIEAEGGVIDKYIGDEIMALFGAPVAAPDSADRAVRAALAMREALAGFNRELAAEGRPPLAFGVGINTAHVVAGNIGSHRRLNYSVIGDGVNLAARLQTLTRRPEFAADILISESTRAALAGRHALRDLGETDVKGKSRAVRIHAVDGADGGSGQS
jgi:adenylate cyclase